MYILYIIYNNTYYSHNAFITTAYNTFTHKIYIILYSVYIYSIVVGPYIICGIIYCRPSLLSCCVIVLFYQYGCTHLGSIIYNICIKYMSLP